RIFVCHPASAGEEKKCASEILSQIARRAYRGLDTEEDLNELLAFYESGHELRGFEGGIQTAIERALSSPKFLFRIERDPPAPAPGSVYRLPDLELASRLSFFLWSSIPDDELLDLAHDGKLADPTALKAQVA